MRFDSSFYSNKVSAESIITSHIVREINKKFKNINSLEEFQSATGFFIVPYKLKDPMNTTVDLLKSGKFTKTNLYDEFSSISENGDGVLVFHFLRRELYCIVPFSEAYLGGKSTVVCFGREACLMEFKDFLYHLASTYQENS